MSTALVSAAIYEYDVLCKNNNLMSPKSHMKTTGSERKAVAVGFASVRRTSSASAAAAAAAMAQCLKLNNASMLSLSDTTMLMATTTTHSHRKLDRSLSEPVERSSSAQQQQRGSQANSSRYKTELCRPFEENGTCKYGDKCQFAHGAHELRNLARHPKYKTELCRTFHTIGFCPYGPRCHFIHNADESRKIAIPGSGGGSRPKALSIGSFSLGSAGESPPSSLSESPTSLGSFFDDAPTYSSPSATPTANNAFSFGGAQEFTSLVPLSKQQQGSVSSSNRIHNQFTINMIDLRNLNELDSVFRETTPAIPIQDQEPAAPLSPVDSLGSELDNLSLSGSPTNMSALRLPIFSRLSTSED